MKRVYKDALTSLQTISIMAEVADEEFDPEIFQPFHQHILGGIAQFRNRETALVAGIIKIIGEDESFGKALQETQSERRRQR